MAFFICDVSALMFLLHNRDKVAVGEFKPTRAQPRAKTVPDAGALKELGFPDGINDAIIHLNVADAGSRSVSSIVSSHV